MPPLTILTKRLHDVARDPRLRLVLSRHCRERMVERRVARSEITRVLRRGHVVEDQGDRLRMRGRDVDGRVIDVVLVLDEREVTIVLVTVIA